MISVGCRGPVKFNDFYNERLSRPNRQTTVAMLAGIRELAKLNGWKLE